MWASIHLPRLTDTFMFHGWVMYRHLKEQKLALFTSLRTKGILETSSLISRLPGQMGPEQHCIPDSTVCYVVALFESKDFGTTLMTSRAKNAK